MNFVNNWQRALVLAGGVTSLALDLPDGDFRLTLADSATQPTRWEIVLATVVGGAATLTRAQEGTTDQSWPSGSVIYCSLTAGQVASIFAELASLAARVTALEPPPGPVVWNSATALGPASFSTDQLTLTVTDETVDEIAGSGICVATRPLVGKSYFEVSLAAPNPNYSPGNVGVARESFGTSEASVLLVALMWGSAVINNFPGSESDAPGAEVFSGDTVRVAVDVATSEMWIAVSGNPWLGGGDPATGTLPTIGLPVGEPLFPFVWGNTPGSSATGRFDAGAWLYSAPSGFSAIPLA